MLKDIVEHGISLILSKFSWLLVFFAPTGPTIFAIGFIIMCDAYTGTRKSIKAGDKFDWRKIRHTFDKFTSYGIGILVAYLVQYLWLPDFPALKAIATLVVYVELKSVNGNIEALTGVNMFKGIINVINPKNKKA